MPNCKFCGQPVTSAPVYHPECLEKQAAGGWINPKKRPPTEDDANEVGMILAVLEDDGLAKTWWWDIVARHSQWFSGWMPLPEPPK